MPEKARDFGRKTEAPRVNQRQRRLYSCARWRRLRESILRRDKGLCVECYRNGRITDATDVDHIARATDNPDLFFDPANLQSLCKPCHSAKTQREGSIT